MKKDATPRVIRVADFVAESLEAEANKLPHSRKDQADLLRKQAAIMRESEDTKMVKIWPLPDVQG
jgi:hypothetical protein